MADGFQFRPGQQDAFDGFEHWFAENRNTGPRPEFTFGEDEIQAPVFRLFGYAGTGKSFVASKIEASVPKVRYVTFTGKAAQVLRAKGVRDVSTIHSAIYLVNDMLARLVFELEEAIEKRRAESPGVPASVLKRQDAEFVKLVAEHDKLVNGDTGPSFVKNPKSEIVNYDLVVVDECSMVDDRIARDLRSFGVPILAMGDPGQLPPVGGRHGFAMTNPDAMLTEIVRQAADNPIIQLATAVRKGERLKFGRYGESEVIEDHRIRDDELLDYDQIIVGTNRTRRITNKKCRRLRGFNTPYPVAGDKLVCLRNNDKHEVYIANGSLWTVLEVSPPERGEIPAKLQQIGTGEQCSVRIPKLCFEIEKADKVKFEKVQFDYGYAITCHKSQGSEWRYVLVMDESQVFRQDARKWLYTAITRASLGVTVAMEE